MSSSSRSLKIRVSLDLTPAEKKEFEKHQKNAGYSTLIDMVRKAITKDQKMLEIDQKGFPLFYENEKGEKVRIIFL